MGDGSGERKHGILLLIPVIHDQHLETGAWTLLAQKEQTLSRKLI